MRTFLSILSALFVLLCLSSCIGSRATPPENIRVLIGASDFQGLEHESVLVTSTEEFIIYHEKQEYLADFLYLSTERITEVGTKYILAPQRPEVRLYLPELARAYQSPRYRGTLEITRTENGFIVVNELPIEQYLYAVVPSEMPSSYGVEASKVQAVTARTFAYYQKEKSNFEQYNAHVDDSVISQVYNNYPETDISVEAVNATRGQVITHNGELIHANYFSTSGGTTANFGEVWAARGEFPTHTPEFLRAGAQFFGELHIGDLRTEEAAAAFFKNTEIGAIDKDFPWFRWTVTLTAQELSERINAALPARLAAAPSLVTFLGEPADSIGELVDIEITRRGQGGNVMEAIFYGTGATIRVQTEYNIRTLLAPHDIAITRHDGTTAQTRLLPSAFFTMDKDFHDTGLFSVTFYGGGNGHGVGMSQNGVRALLDMGLGYVDILEHYYKGVVLVGGL